MTTVQVRLIETGIFLLLMFLSGFWLSRGGKPYPGGKFNLHKFIGLGTGVFLIVMVYRAHQAAPLSAAQVTAVAITALLFLLTISGLTSRLTDGRVLHKHPTNPAVPYWIPAC